MATREDLSLKADQPRVTTKELARTEKRDGSVGGRTSGPTLQYKNVDVKLTQQSLCFMQQPHTTASCSKLPATTARRSQ